MMKAFRQHGSVSTYEHCLSTAEFSYDLNRFFRLNADLNILLKGAMLHDYYLYDWHIKDKLLHPFHGLTHAEKAGKNARDHFDIDDDIHHVIHCHMWPLNPERIPLSKEAWIVCLADKCVTLYETFFRR